LLCTTANIVIAGFLVQVNGFQAGHGHQGHQIAFIAHQVFAVFVFVTDLNAFLDKGMGGNSCTQRCSVATGKMGSACIWHCASAIFHCSVAQALKPKRKINWNLTPINFIG